MWLNEWHTKLRVVYFWKATLYFVCSRSLADKISSVWTMLPSLLVHWYESDRFNFVCCIAFCRHVWTEMSLKPRTKYWHITTTGLRQLQGLIFAYIAHQSDMRKSRLAGLIAGKNEDACVKKSTSDLHNYRMAATNDQLHLISTHWSACAPVRPTYFFTCLTPDDFTLQWQSSAA
jgi:hypothetical protein